MSGDDSVRPAGTAYEDGDPGGHVQLWKRRPSRRVVLAAWHRDRRNPPGRRTDSDHQQGWFDRFKGRLVPRPAGTTRHTRAATRCPSAATTGQRRHGRELRPRGLRAQHPDLPNHRLLASSRCRQTRSPVLHRQSDEDQTGERLSFTDRLPCDACGARPPYRPPSSRGSLRFAGKFVTSRAQ